MEAEVTKANAMLRAALMALALALSAAPVSAGVSDDAAAAYILAEQGDAGAQYNLGVMYDYGDVPQDDVEAVKWYRRAAKQGDAGAQVMLGAVYADGLGVSQDDVLAHMWFNLVVRTKRKIPFPRIANALV
jgi:TPR repeat protein